MTNDNELFQQIMRARNRVYQLCSPTPLEQYPRPGGGQLLLKREDLSPIHTFKWRGAYNMLAAQPEGMLQAGVVASSVGNHARGLALAAAKVGCAAFIYVPETVSRARIDEITRLGEGHVQVIAAGDTFDQCTAVARADAEVNGRLYVPAYDDLLLMAGEGTIGDELMLHPVLPDVLFLQIGGGSLAAAVACAVKAHSPEIHIIGVEDEGQACMAAAIAAGHPVTLPHADVFCDATAATHAGELSYALCREYVDEFMTVSKDDVCAAIQFLWETSRAMVEPSGALGVAGHLRCGERFSGLNVGAIVTGANMDFSRLSWIAARSAVGLRQKRFYEIEVPERSGTVLELLRSVTRLNLNVDSFLYGKTHETEASTIFGFAGSPDKLADLERRLGALGYTYKDVSNREDVLFRIVNNDPRLFKRPYLARLEFPERAGALLEFLAQASHWANVCYFNYACTGEQVGHALIGFEFDSEALRVDFLRFLKTKVPACTPVEPTMLGVCCNLFGEE